MFMTFKPSRGSRRSGGGDSMQRVNAARARNGAHRRAACANCQKKKIRCTGDMDTCDGCKTQGTSCVFSKGGRRRAPRASSATQSANSIDPSRSAEHFAGHDGPVSAPELTASHDSDKLPSQPSPPLDRDISDDPTLFDDIGHSANDEFGSETTLESCSCTANILRLVQKLDDDEFRLRILTFDQVLKLQKWLTFQCLQPLQCTQCGQDPMMHSTVLIVCERIVSMTRCLSRRLRALMDGLRESADKTGTAIFEILQSPELLGLVPVPHPFEDYNDSLANLYDGESGQSGVLPTCTLHLFSQEFRAQYSSDEQCRMIHVLSKMQIENCFKLLKRLESLSVTRTARYGKIQALQKRLQYAGEVTDECLESISEAFSLQI